MRVFLTKRAEKNYRSIKDYIITEWGQSVGDAFEQRAIDFLDLIEKYPDMGIVEVPEKQIRSFLITNKPEHFTESKEISLSFLPFLIQGVIQRKNLNSTLLS